MLKLEGNSTALAVLRVSTKGWCTKLEATLVAWENHLSKRSPNFSCQSNQQEDSTTDSWALMLLNKPPSPQALPRSQFFGGSIDSINPPKNGCEKPNIVF